MSRPHHVSRPGFTLYVASHNHEYGVTCKLFWLPDGFNPQDLEDVIVKQLGLDFEPERDEWIDIVTIGPNDITEIKVPPDTRVDNTPMSPA